MRASVVDRYELLARDGGIVPDHNQRRLAEALDALLSALDAHARPSRKNPFRRLIARRGRALKRPRGLYIFGDVGRGKTLLLDLFYGAVPDLPKRRVHFHAFMADVHERIDRLRRANTGTSRKSDPIAAVGAEIASEVALLCFDEFAVHDIADAMILGRLFEKLFACGTIVVATSNSAPDALYDGGLNRSLFLPFIAMLKENMALFHLEAPRDFRLDAMGSERRYVAPLGPEAAACLDAHFRHLTGVEKGEPKTIVNKGRRIVVPEAADGVARFSFEDLCARPLGAGDYHKIADAFHTIILVDVPILEEARRNEARRLIDLLDVLYDKRTRIIVSAEAEPHALWKGTTGSETLEFARAASRLVEMRSDAYWEAASPRAAQTKKARAI